MKKWAQALTVRLVPPIGAWFIRLVGATLRIRRQGFEPVLARCREGQNAIFAFWHAQQLMMPLVYPGREAYVLVSRHRDGELIHRTVARFGLQTVRGSTTRGGATALRRLVQLGRRGADLVVTPDGPKGPRQVAKLGVIQLAKATGLPIIPVAVGYSKKNSFRVGTCFRFPAHSGERSMSVGRLYGCRMLPRTRNSSGIVRHWRAS